VWGCTVAQKFVFGSEMPRIRGHSRNQSHKYPIPKVVTIAQISVQEESNLPLSKMLFAVELSWTRIKDKSRYPCSKPSEKT